MGTFLRAITDGVLQGGVYGLMAVGLTLIFGVLDLINIAQGILVVLGAYLSYVLWTHLHIDVFAGLLITIPAMFLLGVAIQYLFIRPLRGRERTSMSLLACYAVAIIIEGILDQPAGGVQDLGVLPPVYLRARLRAGGGVRGGDLPAAVPDPVRPQRARHHAGPHRGPADRDRREPRGRAHLRDRGRGDRGGWHGVRDAQLVQPEHRVRPDLPAAGHRHPRRHGQHRRRARGVRGRDHSRVAGGRVLEPRMVHGGVLRGARARARVPAPGPVRAEGGKGAMRSAAIWRSAGLVVLLAIAATVPLAKNVTVTHVGVFVLLYVGAGSPGT